MSIRRVTLKGTDLSTSVLGFGTAHLMTRLGRRESLRLLQAAFDAGITHYDTARFYGYGEAERAVGDFIRGRRNQVTIATKFGIEPPNNSLALRAGKVIARAVVRVDPRLRRTLRTRADALVKRGRFDARHAQRSLETSLRAMRTDYVDVLFLHECRLADLDRADELRAFLDETVARGLVRYYGVATDFETVKEVTAASRPPWKVVQFASDAYGRQAARLGYRCLAMITHSPMSALLRRIAMLLDPDPRLARHWSDSLQADCRDSRVMARLLLGAALASNPHGVVLFGASTPDRIRLNAVDACPMPWQVDALSRLLDELQPLREHRTEVLS